MQRAMGTLRDDSNHMNTQLSMLLPRSQIDFMAV